MRRYIDNKRVVFLIFWTVPCMNLSFLNLWWCITTDWREIIIGTVTDKNTYEIYLKNSNHFLLRLTFSHCKYANQFQFAVVISVRIFGILDFGNYWYFFTLIFILLTSMKFCFCNEILVGAILFGPINCILWKPMHRPLSVKISMPIFSYSLHIYVLYKSVKLLSLLSVSSRYNWILTSYCRSEAHLCDIWGLKFQEYWDCNLLECNTLQFDS